MFRTRALVVFAGLLVAPCLLAQGPTTPKAGSAERKAIMDALRVPIQKTLKKKLVFKVDHLKVQGGWAFLYGVPQQPGGKKMDYKGTRYQDAIDSEIFDDNFCGLLKKQGSKWIVKDWRLGMTDVAWDGWDKHYGAPKGIFPKF